MTQEQQDEKIRGLQKWDPQNPPTLGDPPTNQGAQAATGNADTHWWTGTQKYQVPRPPDANGDRTMRAQTFNAKDLDAAGQAHAGAAMQSPAYQDKPQNE